jgi:hypothetical protein
LQEVIHNLHLIESVQIEFEHRVIKP